MGIDGLAGPSELAIVADATVDPAAAALDLIAQAEHDPEARTFLITAEPDVIDRVGAALDDALATAGRREIVDAALAPRTHGARPRPARTRPRSSTTWRRSTCSCSSPIPTRSWPPSATPARSSSGPWSAVPFGDYGVASNHVLPTAGTARFASGLRAADYVTVRSVVEMSAASATRLAPETSTIARSEGLVGHAAAMDARMTRDAS